MKTDLFTMDDETFRTLVIAWAVIVITTLGILLPYAINVPTLPALFFTTVSGHLAGPSGADSALPRAGSASPDGLLVWYTFEEDIGKVHWVLDHSGNGNNAAANGLFIGNGPGIVGNRSVSLSGLGYLYSQHNPAAGKTNVTFSFWFTAADRNRNYRLASSAATEEPVSGWILGSRSSELWDDAGDPVRVMSGERTIGTLPFDEWNHKALVYNGTHVTEYLNGAVTSRYAATGRPLGSGRGMMIGSWQPFGNNYAGQIDEFRIYDRALDAGEIAGLYRQGA